MLAFLMSSAGAQWTYAGLAITNAVLICNIFAVGWLAKPPRDIIVGERDGLFALHILFEMLAFYLAIYVTGAHPQFTAQQFAPYIRLAWFAALVTFVPAVVKMTVRIAQVIWRSTGATTRNIPNAK